MESPMKQPNNVTDARYELSAIQKNVLYGIMEQLQNKMILKNETLFGEQVFDIELQSIDKTQNYTHIKAQLNSLRYKSIEYTTQKDGGKVNETVSSLISGWTHDRGSKVIRIHVPSLALPFLCQIEEGFTQYRKAIAMGLRSKFSKRLYEMCCRWVTGKNAPFAFQMSIATFVDKFKLGKQYLKPAVFKKVVLEVAMKELTETKDVWFKYSVKKIGKGDYMVTFKIFSADPNHNKNNKGIDSGSEWYIFVYNTLQHYVYGHNDDTVLRVVDQLSDGDKMRAVYKSLKKKLDIRDDGGYKSSQHFKNTIKKSLREDFGVIMSEK